MGSNFYSAWISTFLHVTHTHDGNKIVEEKGGGGPDARSPHMGYGMGLINPFFTHPTCWSICVERARTKLHSRHKLASVHNFSWARRAGTVQDYFPSVANKCAGKRSWIRVKRIFDSVREHRRSQVQCTQTVTAVQKRGDTTDHSQPHV